MQLCFLTWIVKQRAVPPSEMAAAGGDQTDRRKQVQLQAVCR